MFNFNHVPPKPAKQIFIDLLFFPLAVVHLFCSYLPMARAPVLSGGVQPRLARTDVGVASRPSITSKHNLSARCIRTSHAQPAARVFLHSFHPDSIRLHIPVGFTAVLRKPSVS